MSAVDDSPNAAVDDEVERFADLPQHLHDSPGIVAGVLESLLDRVLPIDESRVGWADPLRTPRAGLDDATAIRFETDLGGDLLPCACLLPAWLLLDADNRPRAMPSDMPARLMAGLMPESMPFRKPRAAERGELVDPDAWAGTAAPHALRVPFDGRDEPLWILLGVQPERVRIGHHRLQNVPVRVVVTLAEKRIEVGQLVGISPGTLIAFSKPCEDLLDLYVNNQRFCRGEAVKIGEKFGLKVTEMGGEKPRISSLVVAAG